jgi:valyl-tRNA synthetase
MEAGEVTRARLKANRPSLLALGRLQTAELAEAPPPGSASFPAGDATAALGIAAFIDVEAERARLVKARVVAEKDDDRLAAKLDNPEFTARAPESVVAETLQKRQEAQAALAKIRFALERLDTVS